MYEKQQKIGRIFVICNNMWIAERLVVKQKIDVKDWRTKRFSEAKPDVENVLNNDSPNHLVRSEPSVRFVLADLELTVSETEE